MEPARTVAVTGASGLVGRALADAFTADGVRILRLVRRASNGPDEVHWDPARDEIEADKLEGLDALFHLAGKGIADQRWTPAVKQQIVDSRVRGTRLIAESVANLRHKPRVLVSASAVGFYGDRGAEPVDEDSPGGEGFLAETCEQWEAAGAAAWESGVRVVQVRIGMVLSPKGGALAKMLPVFKLGAGGVVGTGDQVISWIALPDLIRVLRFVADVESMHGVVNATTPGAVTNREFTKALGAQLGRPTFLPAPSFAVKALMGEAAGPLLFQGARVAPKRLTDAGFTFETPDLPSALSRLLA
ncbi:Epimerase family protein [Planctomycetes bacterium MalM25]|nr:Epimerase family protein [Planctomycetes bacterium MalM25]